MSQHLLKSRIFPILLRKNGFPEEERQALEDLNATPEEINRMTETVINLEPITESIPLPESFRFISNGQAFNGNINIPKAPENSSTLSILAFGILGGGAILKRKLKSANSTEKETTKIS